MIQALSTTAETEALKLQKPLAQDAIVLFGAGTQRFRSDQSFSSFFEVAEISRFSDGELSARIPASVRDKDVYVIQSIEPPANESLMELCLTLDALKKASAKRITVILPYMAYARSDRRTEERGAIGAQLVARFIEEAGADRAIILDLHAEQIQGFFRIPVDNVYGTNVLMPEIQRYLRQENIKNTDLVIVSPDAGGAKRARAMAKLLGARFALIDKMRPRANEVEGMVLLGEVKDSVCLLIDDMIDTAGTLTAGAGLLHKNGATRILAACTHGLFSGEAQSRIEASAIEKFFVTDSVRIDNLKTKKIEIVPLASFLEDLIYKESFGESLQDFRQHITH